MITMTPAQALWIREVVWPPARRVSDHPWLNHCSCERTRAQNSSSSCSAGRHDRCNWFGSLPLRRIPEASLCIASGKTYWIHLADVWEEHHAHYANCPCECHLDQMPVLFRQGWAP